MLWFAGVGWLVLGWVWGLGWPGFCLGPNGTYLTNKCWYPQHIKGLGFRGAVRLGGGILPPLVCERDCVCLSV